MDGIIQDQCIVESMQQVNQGQVQPEQPQEELSPLVKLIKEKSEALKHFIILVKVQNPPIREQVAELIRKEFGLKHLRDNVDSEISFETVEETGKKLEHEKEVTEQQIDQRIAGLSVEDNESNWTDATESIAADDQDQIWMVDDDIIAAMDEGSDEEGQGEQKNQQSQEGQKPKQDVNFEELQQQFVKGKESNEDWRVGLHDKFCTSVNVSSDGKAIFSGGGDDRLLCFREQNGKWEEFYRYQHTETVTKIEVSNDGKYVVSLTENQIICTDIATLQSQKLDVEQPTDILCHRQGGVVVAAHDYSVSIFNLKGFSLFSTYCLDLPPSIIALTDTGKQVVAACENKLRIITPKTSEISKVGGADFHKEEISALVTGGNIIVSGCIEGKIYSSNLSKASIIGTMDAFKGAINCLSLADNYVVVGPQGDGVHWVDLNKMKRIFQNPTDISASAIVQVHSANHYAISNLEGRIYFVDRRSPMAVIGKVQAGNTVHNLVSKGSQVYAACEDGYVRVFDLSKLI